MIVNEITINSQITIDCTKYLALFYFTDVALTPTNIIVKISLWRLSLALIHVWYQNERDVAPECCAHFTNMEKQNQKLAYAMDK